MNDQSVHSQPVNNMRQVFEDGQLKRLKTTMPAGTTGLVMSGFISTESHALYTTCADYLCYGEGRSYFKTDTFRGERQGEEVLT